MDDDDLMDGDYFCEDCFKPFVQWAGIGGKCQECAKQDEMINGGNDDEGA